MAIIAASCVADDQPNAEQPAAIDSASSATIAATTTSTPPRTTTTIEEPQAAEAEREPTEIRLAPGWQTVAQFDEDFVVTSMVEIDGLLFATGGGLAGSDAVQAELLYVVDPALGMTTLVPWPDTLVVGDVANIVGTVVVPSQAGLWRIAVDSLHWDRVAAGDWSNAVPVDDRLVRLDGVAWAPAVGLSDMAPGPFGEPRATASWVSLGEDLFLLDRGFWQYVATTDEWRELQRPSLASAAMAITRVGDDVVAADYQMNVLRWAPASERWEPLPDLPLEHSECLPQPVAGSTFAGFQLCSGIALWRLDGWITTPLGPTSARPFAVEESLFATEPGRIHRYDVLSDALGPLVGSTVPVGESLFDVPSGWTVQRQEVVGETGFNEPVAETIVVMERGERCTLTATWIGLATARRDLVENRRGQLTRIENLDAGVLVSGGFSSDVVEIQCDEPEDVATMASRIWWQWVPIAARWLDPGPLQPRGGHSVIWTGDEMIVWGGRSDEETSSRFDDGAAYDPATQTWRALTSAGLEPRFDHIAVWSGSEMLILGGGDGTSGAAYDPASDAWRSLPAAPFAVNRNIGWTWTSERLVVWQPRTDLVAALDPETDEWTDLAPTGLGLDNGVLRNGQERVVALAVVGDSGSEIAATVLDELTGTWRPLPGIIIDGAFPASRLELIANTSVRNGRLLVWGQSGFSAATTLVDPEWQQLGTIDIDGCEGTGQPIDQDGLLVAISWCGADAVFDDADLSWQSTSLPGWGDRSTTVWTGSELLSWGDTCCYGGGATPFAVDPWLWTPPQSLVGPAD